MSGSEAVASCAGREGCASISPVPDRSAEAVDLELLQRIAARDDSALAALYDRHARLAYSLILRIVRSAADADEVLQETFVRVWTRADTYDCSARRTGGLAHPYRAQSGHRSRARPAGS